VRPRPRRLRSAARKTASKSPYLSREWDKARKHVFICWTGSSSPPPRRGPLPPPPPPPVLSAAPPFDHPLSHSPSHSLSLSLSLYLSSARVRPLAHSHSQTVSVAFALKGQSMQHINPAFYPDAFTLSPNILESTRRPVLP
jgi:hypothetical protein